MNDNLRFMAPFPVAASLLMRNGTREKKNNLKLIPTWRLKALEIRTGNHECTVLAFGAFANLKPDFQCPRLAVPIESNLSHGILLMPVRVIVCSFIDGRQPDDSRL